MPGLNGLLVDPDRVDDDPEDREEAEGGALGARQQRLADRHSVHQHRDGDGDGQRDQRRHPCGHSQDAEQDEKQQQRYRRDQRTPRE